MKTSDCNMNDQIKNCYLQQIRRRVDKCVTTATSIMNCMETMEQNKFLPTSLHMHHLKCFTLVSLFPNRKSVGKSSPQLLIKGFGI